MSDVCKTEMLKILNILSSYLSFKLQILISYFKFIDFVGQLIILS